MTTLDEVFEQIQIFDRALLEFNERLRASAVALQKSDDEIGALWQDVAAQRYRRVYEPLARSLKQYINSDAPRFEHFLKTKIHQLGIFLHGQ